MTPSSMSVLRLSGQDEHISSLLRDAILTHFHPSITKDNNHNYTVTVDNKYFRANVALQHINQNNDVDNPPPTTEMQEDGMILTFDAQNNNKNPHKPDASQIFDGLGFYHEQAESMQQCGDLLRLCVGVTKLSSSNNDNENVDEATKEKEYSRRVLWCLDHGYEYVEVDLSAEAVLQGHDVRDKDGFARVVEAVGSTVWSCSVMHPRGGGGSRNNKQPASLAEAVLAGVSSSGDGKECAVSDTKGDETDRKLQPQTLSTTSEEGSETQASTQPETELQPSSETHSQDQQDQHHKDEEEIQFDQMEAVLREAAQIRASAKAGHYTSDTERRQKASDAALKLMGLFGGAFEDSDEEAEDSENEGSRHDQNDGADVSK